MAPSVEISPAFACTTAPCRKETKRKPTRPTVSRMMPPPGLQIYLRHRATLSFDLLAPKFDRFMTLPRFNRFKTLLLVLLLRLLNPLISLPFSNLSTGLRSTNASNINFSHSPTKFLQPLNLAIFTTLSLFNLLTVPAPHLLSLFLAPSPPTIYSLKIIDSSFRYTSPRLWNKVPDSFHQPQQSCLDSTPHPLVNLSLSSSPLSSSITPTLFHSRLKTYLFNKSFPPQDFFYLLDCLMIMGPDRTYHAYQFIFSFTFIFFVYSVW